MNSIPEISVVIPCYDEEENVCAITAAVVAALEPVTTNFEILFIDNSSTDNTVPLIRELCAADERVRLIINTRNFGQMRSPTHMIYQARGLAIIGLCADFQDPPEMIPQFIERWRAGTDIVLGIRQSARDSWALKTVRELAYMFARRFGDYPIIPNATGFGLYSRRVVEATAQLWEPEPFFRGMLVETGYTVETIPYSRPQRAGGYSKNNFAALADFALSSLAGSAKRLVRVPFLIGIVGLLGTFIFFVISPFIFLFTRHGWAWLVATLFQFQFGLLFLFLGLIGDQVRLLGERTRRTPLVFERERVNFPEGSPR